MRHLRRHRALTLAAALLVLLISIPVMATPLCTCDTCSGATSCHEEPEPVAEHACCAEEPAPGPERTAHPCECAFSGAPALPDAAHPERTALVESPTTSMLLAVVPVLVPTLVAPPAAEPTVSPPIFAPPPEGGSITIALCALLR